MEHKNTFAQIIILIVLVVLGIIATSIFKTKIPLVPPVTDEPIACTMDARMCPDGSYVGRQGPKCEFAACPAPLATSTSSVSARIDERVQIGAFSITPRQVLEDSRCPANVQCIQAGTVRLRVEVGLASASTTKTVDVTLDTPAALDTGSTSIKLSEVAPVAVAGTNIATSTYQFTFIIQ